MSQLLAMPFMATILNINMLQTMAPGSIVVCTWDECERRVSLGLVSWGDHSLTIFFAFQSHARQLSTAWMMSPNVCPV